MKVPISEAMEYVQPFLQQRGMRVALRARRVLSIEYRRNFDESSARIAGLSRMQMMREATAKATNRIAR